MNALNQTKLELFEFLCCKDHLEEEKPMRNRTLYEDLNNELAASKDIADLCERSSILLANIIKLADNPDALDIFTKQAEVLSYMFKDMAYKCPKKAIRSMVSEWIREEKTLREMADLLNQQGLTTHTGKMWTHALVAYAFKDLFEANKTNPAQVSAPLRAKELRDRGWTLDAIAHALNDEGFSTLRGGAYSSGTVHHLLKD
jgi:hypothetical protein